MSREILSDDDYWARRSAIVRAWGARDVETLIGGLRDPDHRWKAAKYLGRVGDERALEPLRLLLGATDGLVRAEAATALGRLRLEAALPDLVEVATSDPEAFVRGWAVDAIRLIGLPSAVPALLPRLDDPDPGVRLTAVRALGDLADESVVATLHQHSRQESVRRRIRYRRAIGLISRRSRAKPRTV